MLRVLCIHAAYMAIQNKGTITALFKLMQVASRDGQITCPKITFHTTIFNVEGKKPHSDRIQVIIIMPSVAMQQLIAFLGMKNFMQLHIPHLCYVTIADHIINT